MASVKSSAITNLDAVPAVNADGGNNSPMMVWHDTYEAASLASGSDITIARIPAGATIHDVVIKADALGGSSTLKVGGFVTTSSSCDSPCTTKLNSLSTGTMSVCSSSDFCRAIITAPNA